MGQFPAGRKCFPVLWKIKSLAACLSSVKWEDIALLVELVQGNT